MDRDAVIARLRELPHWGSPGIECGIRAGFRCEYCDRDLLASLNDYKAWAQDHIVPGGGDALDNMAVACHPCNSLYKGKWDPRGEAGHTASREELIAVTRRFIGEERRKEQIVLAEVRALVGWPAVADPRPAE